MDFAYDGLTGMHLATTNLYDAIILDLAMPEMDGIAATHDVRQLPGGAGSIPIVALTAHALPGDKERFLAAGMNDYLTKPINRAAALHCIARWTGARATAEPEDGAIQSAPVKLLAESGEAYVDELQSDAHTLKSSAGTFGAFELQQLALDVELACRNGLPRDAAEKARRIPEAWNQVSMELDRFLANSAIARSKAR